MDDKKSALAIFLSILVIITYTEIFMKQPPAMQPLPVTSQGGPVEAGSRQSSVGTGAEAMPAGTTTLSNPAAAAAGQVPSREAYLQSPSTTIESDQLLVKISHLGGRIVDFKLKQYKARLGSQEPLAVVNDLPRTFPLGVYTGGVNDQNVSYQLTGVTAGAPQRDGVYFIPEQGTLSLSFSGTLPNGSGIKKTIQFSEGRFFFDVDIELSAPSADGSSIWLEWVSGVSAESRKESWNPTMFVMLSSDNSITRLASESAETAPVESSDKWVSFGDNYFLTAMIPTRTGPNVTIWKEGDAFFFRSLGGKKDGKFVLYVGPRNQEYLGENSFGLTRSIDLGWFAFIGQPILISIEVLHFLLGGNYGLAIILLTLLVKTLLLPLTSKSFKSMKAMQDLQPELKILRERCKDKPNDLNQATMALFKERGVNPMGGCFPMLIQLPIFLGMYNALRTSFSLRHAPFALWINDLSAPEKLQLFGIPVPVMILIMGVSMFLQQITTPSSAPPEQQRMMLMMPLFFTIMFIIWPFPSGLVLYWLVNNLISIVQQMALRSERNITPLQATVLGGAAIFSLGFIVTLL